MDANAANANDVTAKKLSDLLRDEYSGDTDLTRLFEQTILETRESIEDLWMGKNENWQPSREDMTKVFNRHIAEESIVKERKTNLLLKLKAIFEKAYKSNGVPVARPHGALRKSIRRTRHARRRTRRS